MKKNILKLICAVLVLIPMVTYGKITCSSSNHSASIEVSKNDLSINDKSFISIKSDENYIVSYSASDNKVIKVTDDGIVTPLKEGTSDILITISFILDNDVVAICNSKVSINVLSSDSRLKSLSIEEHEINFQSNVLNYEITLPYKNDSINVLATPNHQNAKVIGTGKRYLNEGENNFDVIVTSESGSSTTYHILVNRDFASNDSTLKSLSVNNYVLSPMFSSDVLEYDLKIDKNVDEINIKAIPNYESAKVTGIGKYKVASGKTTFYINVTAENNSNQTYTINVYKDKGSSKLKSLEITGYDISFNEDTYLYNLTVKNDVNSLEIKTEASDNSQIEVIGGDDLSVGENEIIIRVTDKDETVTTYKVLVNRLSVEEQKEIVKNNTLLIILFIIFIISIIIMFSSIGIFIHRFYNKNKLKKIDKKELLKRIKR